MDPIPSLIAQVDPARIAEDLFYLSSDPLPCRQLNVTLPGHSQNTLYEADAAIQARLEAWGYRVEREGVLVQCFRPGAIDPDPTRPYPFSRPEPEDPWAEAFNLYAKIEGATHPNEWIVVVAHKDSQSWIDCAPGAYDNAVGTAATLEMARVLSGYRARRSIEFLYCNEEHRPWTSVTAAQNMAAADAKVVAVLNVDGIGGRAQSDVDAGRWTNVTRYTTPEGERLADMIADLNERYGIGLNQSKYRSERPGDDDGSFIQAGMAAAVLQIGSCPYRDPVYHTPQDRPERVDLENVRRAAQLCLAAVLHLDGLAGGPA